MKRLEPHRTKSRRGKSPPDGAGAKSVMRAMAEGEALEQNKAITDILRVISSSPTDLEPVFGAVLSHAIRLCKGDAAVLWQYDGNFLRFGASRRAESDKPGTDPATSYFRKNPLPLGEYNPTPQAALEKRIVHVLDVFADRKYRPLIPQDSFGTVPNSGTVLAVPLLRREELFGVISIWRFEKRFFSDKQIAMVEAFAAQAAIAIHNVRLHNETKEALEHQKASADILRVISSSPGDIQPVLRAVAESAARLCDASNIHIRLVQGELIPVVMQIGDLPMLAEVMTQPISAKSAPGRAILERTIIHIPDVMDPAVRAEYTEAPFLRQAGAFRTLLVVPLIREGEAIGTISVRRARMQPFSEQHIRLLQTFAGQVVIAIENVRLFTETRDALERQTATGAILRVIAGTPADAQPVFDAIAQSALRLFGVSHVGIGLRDGDSIHRKATAGSSDPRGEFVIPLNRDSTAGRAMLDRTVINIGDTEAPEAPRFAREGGRVVGFRAIAAAPMLREGIAIGSVQMMRTAPGPFSDAQMDLLKTFADQAVIAIENARLFNETKEALDQQTATSEVLGVISSSPTDLAPVFDAILKSATQLCDAHMGQLNLYDGESLRTVAQRGANPEFARYIFERGAFKPVGGFARMLSERRAVHVPDLREGDAYRAGKTNAVKFVEVGGARTFLAVPLLKEGRVIGGLSIYRPEVRPFTEKQIALVSMFASQAVIAMENVRLFNETKEALERQTASAEVLRVISGTPADAQPVFDAIAQSALRVFKVSHVGINVVEAGVIKVKATGGSHEPRGEFSIPLDRNSTAGRSVLDRALIEVEDTESHEVASFTRDSGRLVGFRAIATAPMLREGTAVGSVSMMRSEPGAFSGKQLELLQTFADQAAIAIENARLFNELQTTNANLREALEQQTATGDILKVISRSTTNVQPVFETIIRNAVVLCEGALGMLFTFDGAKLDIGAAYNNNAEVLEMFRREYPQPVDRETPSGRAIVDRSVVNIPDVLETDYSQSVKDRAHVSGWRALLTVPLMRDDTPIGSIAVARREPGGFADSYVALLQTFADQAVIAIENVRLFNETKEALEQQTAISEVLRVISSSPTDVKPVLEAVCARAARICDASDARIFLAEGDSLRHTAGFGDVPVTTDIIPLSRATAGGRAILDGSPIHIEDIQGESGREYPTARELAGQAGWRTILSVPLIREKQALGTISLRRTMVRPFSDKQIALLKTFADQAAIAIENVRLFNETEEALKHQTATAEVLKTISRSTFDLQAVLQALVDNAARLSGATRAVMHRPDADGIYAPVVTFNYEIDPPLLARLREHPIRPGRDSINGRALLERRPIHVADVLNDREYGRQDLAKAGGFRTVLSVPMLRDGEVIGLISLTKGEEVDPFTDKQIELVTTFADQAVIAIENVRLFNEIQEKSAQLEVANKHKSDFLANMSHELRTPLNAIIGFSEALMERMFGELNDKQSDYLKDIHESGKHLLALINDILDLSKIEAGRMDLEVSSFHLPTALSNAMTLIRERAQRHAIELGLDVDERLGEFQADERKFKQIMLNLLSNAVKFTPDGGRVDVCAKKDTDKIEIAVKDTGIGIAPEDQAAVFEEFKQVGRDQLRKAEGTGLGLALTRRFVELHGGAIRLESTPGKGSTFTVSLPIRN